MPRALLPAVLLFSFSVCVAAPKGSPERLIDPHDNKRSAAPPPGKGVIYVIRKPRFSQRGAKFNVFLDGRKAGYLTNRSYLNFEVEPGEHKVKVTHPSAKVVDVGRAAFQVKEGMSYFLMARYEMSAFSAGVNAKVIDEAEARAMIAKSNFGIFMAPPRRASSVPAGGPLPAAAGKIHSDIDTPGYRSPERPDDFAVVIGIDGYEGLPRARFAERDAETMRGHLLAMGYPKRHVILLKGENATGNGIRKYLEEWLPRNVKPTSDVFFYYSGHGAPDTRSGKAYLVPWDGDASFLKSTAYPVEELYASLNKLRARRVVVALDACFSGAGGRSVLAKGARPLVLKVDEGVLPKGKLVLFTAASSDEITATLEDEGHGVFTYFFIKGLQGAAKNAAGQITAKSLYRYIKPKVQDEARLQNREQTPTLHTAGDIVIRRR
ncbi:MAG: caspase family protein [Elusimicrobiota bacterium]